MKKNIFFQIKELFLVTISSTIIYVIYGCLFDYFNSSNIQDLSPDEESYLNAGKLLFNEGLFDIIRPFGSALFFGFPRLICNNNYCIIQYIIVLQFFAWLFIVILIFKIIKHFHKEKIAFFYAFVYSTLISPIIFSQQILTETIFVFILLLAINEFIKFKLYKNKIFDLRFIFFLCIGCIFKPIILYFTLLYVIFSILNPPSFKINKKQSLYKLSIPFFIFLIPITGMYNNHNYLGLSKGSSNKVIVMMSGLANSIKNNTNINNEIDLFLRKQDSIISKNKIDVENATLIIFKKRIKKDYMFFMKAYLSTIKNNFISGNLFCKNKNDYLLSLFQNVTLSLLIIILISSQFILIILKKIKHKTNSQILNFLCILCIYLILMSGLFFWQGDRYNLPIFPIIIISLAIFQNLHIYNEVRNSHSSIK